MRLSLLQALNVERLARRPAVVITCLADGEQRLALGRDILASARARQDRAQDPLEDAVLSALETGKSRAVESEGRAYFLNVQTPQPRLAIIGAVHAAQALAPMARACGFDVSVIDPRGAFATPERFVGTRVCAQAPAEALAAWPLDAFTALAALTHDPRIDDPALMAALASDCFYVGALGSRKTHAGRLARLREKGFDEAALARIHAPIGLDIGALSPPEIAVSILAEIILAQRKKPSRGQAAPPIAPA